MSGILPSSLAVSPRKEQLLSGFRYVNIKKSEETRG